jgi:F0F1-type ATP synthase membrane subunit b/b'
MQFTGQDLIVSVVLAIAMVKVFRGPIGAALDHFRGRLAEVEERLDFAERLLAQAREADQLHGGAHR